MEDQAKTVLNLLSQLQPLPAHLATNYCDAERKLKDALREARMGDGDGGDKLGVALLIFRGCYSLINLSYEKYPAIQRKLPEEEEFLAFFLSSSYGATPSKAMMGLLHLVANAPLPPASLTDTDAVSANPPSLFFPSPCIHLPAIQ